MGPKTNSMQASTVALVKGKERFSNCAQALRLIDDCMNLQGKRRILIKPNFVLTDHQLAATHVEAVRAVVEFVRERSSAPIVIGESAAEGTASDGFRNYGYVALAERYGVELVDLAEGQFVDAQAFDRNLKPMRFQLARAVVEADFRISVCLPKTHNAVIVTLSLKNIVVGSLQSKSSIHQGCQGINLNLYTLAKIIAPHLSVIDGYVGMEGEGPGEGSEVKMELALASTDFLAADTVAAKIMGYDVDGIGYLHYCRLGKLGVGQMKDIAICGQKLEDCIGRKFKPHHTYAEQLEWQVPDVERYL